MQKIIENEGLWYFEIAAEKDFCGSIVKTQNYPTQIYINSTEKKQGRKNFTTAHELGHFALKHIEQKSNFICSEQDILDGTNDELEREANYFANCFLLPRERIKREFESWFNWKFKTARRTFLNTNGKDRSWVIISSKLKKQFGVTETPLKICLVELGLITNFI
jgi:Zn-dependent peptidase ImmA (M78 family)